MLNIRIRIPPFHLPISSVKEWSSVKLPTNPNTLLKWGFLFFTFFPYLQVVPIITSDVQPYSLLFATMVLFVCPPHLLPKAFLWVLGLVVAATLVLVLDPLQVDSIRNYLGYLSLFVITYATYVYLKSVKEPPYRFIYIAIVVWGAVGVVQLFFPEFLTFLLRRTTGGGVRGVYSLAAEPTFYGIVCLFFGLITHLINHPKRRQINYLLLFQIVILARSSMTILLLMILLGIYFIMYLNLKRLLISLSAFTLAIILFFQLNLATSNIRFLTIIDKLFAGGLKFLIMRDESANDRAAHIYYSIRGFFEDYFLPHGYVGFADYVKAELPKSEVFWWVSTGNKIMSTYGAAFYELGIFGLLVPISISYILFKGNIDRKKGLIMILFINIILFTAIPISFPLLGFLLGCAIFNYSRSLPANIQPE